MSEFDSSSGAKVSVQNETCSTEQNVQFVDLIQGPMTTRNSVEDPTVKQSINNSADLSKFLERPVQIYEFNFSTNSGHHDSYLNPWELWSSHTSVTSKLDNFAYFRGDLMIKVVVNGSPFIYGKSMLSYMPLHTTRQLFTESPLPSPGLVPTVCARSQRPHVIIDYSDDAGACMCLPFLWPENAIRVAVKEDWDSLGQLNMMHLLPPALANAIVGGVDTTVTVFAWATNCELTIPTNSLARSQGPDETDREGLISKPAAVVAAAAASLSAIPVIGPFAMASSIAAGAVGNIAALFGYSKPANVDAPATMRRDPANQLTNTYGVDSTNTLTFDPKSAVTVWPGVTGVDNGGDEMSIDYLKKREAVFQIFDWASTDAPASRVFWAGVHPNETPCLWIDPAPRVSMQPTPLGFVSLPFGRWSGSIKYRFEIIASRLHRGRLKVSWDPMSLAGASAVDNLNTTFSKVIDLTESRNLEFTVAWGRPELFLTMNNTADWYCEDFINGPGVSINDHMNGFIAVTVMNKLTVPIEMSDTSGAVRVLVWVSAGDDFELQLPTDHQIKNVQYRQNTPVTEEAQEVLAIREDLRSRRESKVFSQGADFEADAAQENTQEATQSIELLVEPSPDVRQLKDKICFGETILSFRNLLKRYMYHSTLFSQVGNAATGDAILNTYIRSDFPAYRGYSNVGLYEVDGSSYQAAHTTLLNYLSPAYKCRRGGIRQMLIPFISTDNSGGAGAVTVSRQPEHAVSVNLRTQATTGAVTFSPPGTANPVQTDLVHYDSGFSGMWTTKTNQQGVVKFQTPYYSSSRFISGDFLNVESGVNIGNQDQATLKHKVTAIVALVQSDADLNVKTRAAGAYRRLVSASDDFSLSFFIGAPPYARVAVPPTITAVRETVV